MTRQLMSLANGKLVLVLEGGYDISSICDASEICVQALINEEVCEDWGKLGGGGKVLDGSGVKCG